MKDQRILFRISLFYGIMLVLGAFIIGQVIYLQFAKSSLKDSKKQALTYRELAERVSVRTMKIKPQRGSILSHDGRLLATSLPTYVLRMDFKARGMGDTIFRNNVGGLAAALADFFKDKSKSAYEKQLREYRRDALSGNASRVRRVIDQKVDYIQLQKIKQFPLYKEGGNVGGLIVEQESRRDYPYQRMGYRTIGFMNANNAGAGVELSFNKYLAGVEGTSMAQRTALGQFMPIESDDNIEPQDGCDVVMTLNVEMQDIAETALRRQLTQQNDYFEAGTAVVMDVQTGEIKAMANLKRNNNGTFDESFNYAVGEPTEPGSTFKLASLIAALETGDIDIDDVIDCGTEKEWTYKGHVFRESGHGGLGKASVKSVIAKSSNVGVAKMMIQVFGNNESNFTDFLYDIKLNERVGIELDGEAKPNIKNPKTKNVRWSAYSMPKMATGYELMLAPIQTLTLYNAVANNGCMIKPKLVNEIRQHGSTIQTFRTQTIKESICSKKTVKKVQEVLEAVVTEGTARNISGGPYRIAGKTGTAQIAFGNKGYVLNGMKRHQASFCGYFPADNPKYSCIVVLYTRLISQNSNFYGATWAAPVFKEIADKIYATQPAWQGATLVASNGSYVDMPAVKKGKGNEIYEVMKGLGLPFAADKKNAEWALASVKENNVKIEINEETYNKQVIPMVEGMGLKDAVFLLESMGLRVSFSGKGVVRRQLPQAGEKFSKGQTVVLTLGL